MTTNFEHSTAHGQPDSQTRTADDKAWRKATRERLVALRQALPEASYNAQSARIVHHLLTHFADLATQTVAFCWPIKQEPDIRTALLHWRKQGGRAVLPVVLAPATPLGFREWLPDQVLPLDRYGIPTPESGELLTPQAILLPLNGFDAAGYRLGYGGGFFDRTLAALQPRPLSVGIGFECGRLESIRPQAHDQPLDWLVTEAGVFRPLAE
jgi:5,10-methenyltetrahydrofolate synthetase